MRFQAVTALTLLFVACQSATSSQGVTVTPPGPAPSLGACPVFPADNIWNARVDGLPVTANSGAYVSSIGASVGLHPDFGSGLYEGAPVGIPFAVVPASQPGVAVSFEYASESDRGPYPVPRNAPVEGGSNASGDRHVLIVKQSECKLYELFGAYSNADGSWRAGSGAVWDLGSNALRLDGWTSADAAGLPILPGLVRRDEVAAGEIHHAIRFTAPRTRSAHVWPARHDASSSQDAKLPAMGQRFRLKAGVNLSGFSRDTRIILEAMKRYGVILADNGSAWYISGTPDEGWNNDALVSEFARVKGSDFEAVDSAGLIVSANSGKTKTP